MLGKTGIHEVWLTRTPGTYLSKQFRWGAAILAQDHLAYHFLQNSLTSFDNLKQNRVSNF